MTRHELIVRNRTRAYRSVSGDGGGTKTDCSYEYLSRHPLASGLRSDDLLGTPRTLEP